MLFKRGTLVAAVACLAVAAPGHAWNEFGHELVARIAWQELEPEVRSRVLALLREAPADSRMHCLDLNQEQRQGCDRFAYRLDSAQSSEDGDRIMFERTGYWADLARQLEKYDRPTWHYIGWTWRQGEDGTAHDTDLPVPAPNAVSQLGELALSVADTTGRAEERAIHLAWIFHLVGDVHQPLHAASRVTQRRNEREGDRGGNGFALDEWNRNLHAFWDGALDSPFWAEHRQRLTAELSESGEPPAPERLLAALAEVRERDFERLKDRIAAQIRSRHPLDDNLRAGMKSGDFEAWAKESNQIVRTVLYPSALKRDEAPPAAYAGRTFDIALERVAQAGYRLADLLRQMLGDGAP